MADGVSLPPASPNNATVPQRQGSRLVSDAPEPRPAFPSQTWTSPSQSFRIGLHALSLSIFSSFDVIFCRQASITPTSRIHVAISTDGKCSIFTRQSKFHSSGLALLHNRPPRQSDIGWNARQHAVLPALRQRVHSGGACASLQPGCSLSSKLYAIIRPVADLQVYEHRPSPSYSGTAEAFARGEISLTCSRQIDCCCTVQCGMLVQPLCEALPPDLLPVGYAA